MGAVFVAKHTVIGRRAAIKVLQPELLARPGDRAPLLQRGARRRPIDDPGIVEIFDFGHHANGTARTS